MKYRATIVMEFESDRNIPELTFEGSPEDAGPTMDLLGPSAEAEAGAVVTIKTEKLS